jgi:hypothetical protein
LEKKIVYSGRIPEEIFYKIAKVIFKNNKIIYTGKQKKLNSYFNQTVMNFFRSDNFFGHYFFETKKYGNRVFKFGTKKIK